MTTFRLLSFLLALSWAAAFAPTHSRFSIHQSAVLVTPASPKVLTTATYMSSGDQNESKGLEEVSETSESTMEFSATLEGEGDGETTTGAPIKSVYRNLAKGGEITEVPWVDDAMSANTRPWDMSWWAYILFGLPVLLLANDAFHFLPKDGPLSFLNTL